MQEDSRLGDVGGPELLVAAFKHHIGKPEAEDVVGLFHHFAGLVAALV